MKKTCRSSKKGPCSVERRLRRVLPRLGATARSVRVICCHDREVAALNRRYRHRRGPTDVLTFVYGSHVSRVTCHMSRILDDHMSRLHGEIYIALGVARRQARQREVPVRHELLRLGVHGLAHLAGYDHHTIPDFCAMRKKEFEALVEIL